MSEAQGLRAGSAYVCAERLVKANLYRLKCLWYNECRYKMTDLQRQFVEHCIETDDVHSFYTWDVWERLRLRVLAIDHRECQRCKYVYHRQRAATVVHHRQHLRQHPELALSIWYTDAQGKKHRNLESLCAACHDEVHPEKD